MRRFGLRKETETTEPCPTVFEYISNQFFKRNNNNTINDNNETNNEIKIEKSLFDYSLFLNQNNCNDNCMKILESNKDKLMNYNSLLLLMKDNNCLHCLKH